jgi:carbamoyltransferase
MGSVPCILGINRTQDASVCLMRGATNVCGIQKERLTREKHHWGKVGDLALYAARVPGFAEPLDLLVECFSSDPEIANLEEYADEVRRVLRFKSCARSVRISHHVAHLYSAYFTSPFNDAAVMVIDCMGSPISDLTEVVPGRDALSPADVEVSSFYRCDGRGVRCVAKQVWDVDWARPVGLGCFYFLLSRMLFPGEGNEGKVMGLAPYGDPDALGLPLLHVDRWRVMIPPQWSALFHNSDRFRYFADGSGSFSECANLAAAGQRCFENALLDVARWLHQETGQRKLCFAGGTALNCVANGRLLRESPFEELFVPPSPHDGGSALGCAIYGWVEEFGLAPDFRWINDFLGPIQPAWAADSLFDDELRVERPVDLIQEIVDLLVNGRVVALFQDRSELGPRALGHRSILADPRRAEMRTWINCHVKGRETFRPLAPAVLLESSSRFFQIDRPVPFMQFATDVRPEYRDIIPAVTHVDGTARLQTVHRDADPFFYDLIQAFEKRTGIGVLLNTSFNGKGEPIVETPAEAIACLKGTAMHALAIPPYLIHKRGDAPLPF